MPSKWTPKTLVGLVLAICAGIGLFSSNAGADVARIREMAVELEQKLNKHRFEVIAKAETPNTARIYKDFDFLLKDIKVNEAAEAVGTDPNAERLRLYLIQSIVEGQLASYVDDLREFEQSSTAEIDNVSVSQTELKKRLAMAGESSDRRKVAAFLKDLVETGSVFRSQIIGRRNELYMANGFENYADFYSQREGLDLDALVIHADALLTGSKGLYDSLFVVMADRYLGVEPRKVRFYDLPYLTHGARYAGTVSSTSPDRFTKDLFGGLGIDVTEQPLVIDDQDRPGKVRDAECVPVLLSDLRVSYNPMGCDMDYSALSYAVGESQIFAQSSQSDFETAYLVNQAAQSALAWIPRLVLDDPGWVSEHAKKVDVNEYRQFRVFVTLYEARLLAAVTKFEVAAYRGTPGLTEMFKSLMNEATGARVSSEDSARSLEFLTQLKAASRFQGLLLATGVKAHLTANFGAAWYNGGQAGELLNGLWKQGGTLTTQAIADAANLEAMDAAMFINDVTTILNAQ